MNEAAKVNINSVVDNSRLGLFQWGVFFLCGLCLIMDGFDLQAIGFVAPALIRDWKIPSASMGPVFSAALIGVLIGSLFFSMLADRIGRRPVLIGVTLYFSLLTFLTARAGSINELLILRFLGGIGLGGIMPNAMALVGEYSPTRVRVTAMMVVSNGFTLGAAFGGPIAAWLIPLYGWRGVFYFGAVTPVVIAVLMIFLLPESLQFLALRGHNPAKLSRWLKHVDPSVNAGPETKFVIAEAKKKGVPIIHLFHDGRALGTALLWVVNFMNLLNLYLLSNWLPTVIRDSGYSNTIAVNSGSIFQLGGVVGTLVLGVFVSRFGFTPVLTICFALACLSIGAIGQPYLTLVLLFGLIFVAGFGIPGSQAGLNAFSATYYPTDLRATGVGAGLGIGRVGAIVGPYVVGLMLARHWANREIFLAAAIPALISCVVMLSLRWVIRPTTRTVSATEALVH
ncbi:MAG TPA: MFS transporter [Bryobacteraceae bacterium]|nr:MFS transporter [Bryobacteraceae bacterium]